jgi:hypothetical protein
VTTTCTATASQVFPQEDRVKSAAAKLKIDWMLTSKEQDV